MYGELVEIESENTMTIKDHPHWNDINFVEQCLLGSLLGEQEFENLEELSKAIAEALEI